MSTPTLAEILARPERVADVPPAEVPGMLAMLASLSLALAARLAISTAVHEPAEIGDELLTPEQAAAVLGVDRAFVWRKARRADWRPFTVHVSRKILRIKRRGLERWLARQGAGR